MKNNSFITADEARKASKDARNDVLNALNEIHLSIRAATIKGSFSVNYDYGRHLRREETSTISTFLKMLGYTVVLDLNEEGEMTVSWS